jgi:hypothetical protein
MQDGYLGFNKKFMQANYEFVPLRFFACAEAEVWRIRDFFMGLSLEK